MMRRLMRLTCCLPLLLPMLAMAGPIEDCNRLAADPGVALNAIPLPEAMDSCAAAVELDDGSARLMHQYARTLEAAGNGAAARRYYGWAADDGYPPARMALERLGETARGSAAAAAAEAEPDDDPVRTYASKAGPLPGDLATRLAEDMVLLPHGAALRDPATTLALRRGSAPDLALLLRALLLARDPGADLRFGLCTPRPEATPAAPVPSSAPPLLVSQVIAQALATGDPPALLQRLDQVWRVAMAEGRAEAAALAVDIRAASPGFGTMIAPAPEPLRVSVELREGEVWHAYDPVRGGVFDPSQCLDYHSASQLPDDLTPRLHLSLTAREASGGIQTSRSLLTADVPLAGDAILGFAEAWGITPPEVARERGVQTYTPVLISGGRTVFGDPLRLPLPPSATPEAGAALGDKLGAVAEALGSGADGAAEQTPEKAEPPPGPVLGPVLMALDAALRVDLAGAPAGPEENLALLRRGRPDQPLADANGAYLDLMQLVGIVPLDGAGVAAVPEDAADFVPSNAGLEAQARQGAAAMAGFEGLRRAVMAEIAPVPPPVPRSIGLLATLWTAMPPGPDGSPGLVLRNQMRRGPEAVAAGSADPVADAAAWAVASVLAERLSLQLGNEGFADPPPGSDAVGLWADARAGGAPARILRSGADLDGLPGLPPEARNRALAELGAGRLLLAPPGVTQNLAWWSVDPALGLVEDEFANGNRQAMTEEAETDKEIACRNAGFFADVAARVARAMAPVAIILAVTGHGGDLGKAVVKMTRAVAQKQEEVERKRREVQLLSKACAGKNGGPGPDP